jgi:hypothetical protein
MITGTGTTSAGADSVVGSASLSASVADGISTTGLSDP